MEVYEAKHSYKQVADSVLTFNAGDTFYILGRPSEKWWFAKRIVDNVFGYVPAVYLQPAREKVIGKLVPENRRNSREYDIHMKALAEIHKKVKPLPAHVIENALATEKDSKPSSTKTPQKAVSSVLASRKMASMDNEGDLPEHLQNFPSPPLLSPPPPDYDVEGGAFTYTNGKPYHHKLNISSHPEGERILIPEENEDDGLIKPKPLVNPCIQSRERMDLHRELKHSGRKVLDKPELSKVFRDRKITEKKKEAEKYNESNRTSMEIKLMERQEMLEKEEKAARLAKEGIVENDEETSKPEFAKVKLRQTNASKT